MFQSMGWQPDMSMRGPAYFKEGLHYESLNTGLCHGLNKEDLWRLLEESLVM